VRDPHWRERHAEPVAHRVGSYNRAPGASPACGRGGAAVASAALPHQAAVPVHVSANTRWKLSPSTFSIVRAL